jgi:hypothetical protein
VHSLICISYKTFEIDYYSLFLSFHGSYSKSAYTYTRQENTTGYTKYKNLKYKHSLIIANVKCNGKVVSLRFLTVFQSD